uniref:Uncharacterized protein n=1 Tax=Rhizophora mucronata TaxID=61149 RepID=A0A2P2P961_RHIMU
MGWMNAIVLLIALMQSDFVFLYLDPLGSLSQLSLCYLNSCFAYILVFQSTRECKVALPLYNLNSILCHC